MNRHQIKFFDQCKLIEEIQPAVKRSVSNICARGEFIQGQEVSELEKQLASYVGVRHCIACSDGTAGILVSLMALGISQGDEVVTSAFTFIAAAEAIRLLGAIPVYADINIETYNIDVVSLSKAITSKTRAIVAVDIFGQPAEYEKICDIARIHGIPVVEDAAQSFGSTRLGNKACSFGDVAVTSFFPTKPLGCYGDGGAIFTSDETLATKIRKICSHGQSVKYSHEMTGVNSRLDTIQAAVLLEKLKHLESQLELRRKAANEYDRLIGQEPTLQHVQTPTIDQMNTSVYAQYTIRLEDRSKVLEYFKVKGVGAAVHYPTPLYRQWGEQGCSLPITESVCASVLSLPFYPEIDPSTQSDVIDHLVKALKA